MATDFTQDSVLRFLRSCGGTARNAELLAHFSRFLREEENAARLSRNRELFKRFVNSVATVLKHGDGVTYVSLRKKYRTTTSRSHEVPAQRTSPTKAKGAALNTARVLPAAGILNDNNNDLAAVNLEKPSSLHTHSQTKGPAAVSASTRPGQLPQPDHSRTSRPPEDLFQQPWRPITLRQQSNISTSSPCLTENTAVTTQEVPSLSNNSLLSSVPGGHLGLLSSVPGGHLGLLSSDPSGHISLPSSDSSGYISLLNSDPSGHISLLNSDPAGHISLLSSDPSGHISLLSSDPSGHISLPTIDPSGHISLLSSDPGGHISLLSSDPGGHVSLPTIDPGGHISLLSSDPGGHISLLSSDPGGHVSLLSSDPAGHLSLLSPGPGGHITHVYVDEVEDYGAAAPVSPAVQRQSFPLQTLLRPPAAIGELPGRSSSENSLLLPSCMEPEWPQVLTRDNWSSDNALNYRGNVEQIWDVGSHSQEADLLSQLHRPERRMTPWHHSTGHLLDEEPQASITGSSIVSSSPEDGVYHGPVARRLRNRLCRSLGSDLDQAFREDRATARLKWLHRVSSFLNVSNPNSLSSSRTHSTMDGLSSAGSSHSLAPETTSYGSRHSQVPLEAREHEWFVKAASGNWSDIYSLFREDPSLLNKRDFVSGFTIVHWIAKHGDHRVLNTLCYGVNKTEMTLNVDIKSVCGYTPLHVAAIHGHKNVLRLLVHKFKAGVAFRDNSGKRSWQYLEKCDDRDLMELLGAPQKTAGRGAGVQRSVEKPTILPVAPSAATVKRHSSLAAMFKQKSQLRVSANSESFI